MRSTSRQERNCTIFQHARPPPPPPRHAPRQKGLPLPMPPAPTPPADSKSDSGEAGMFAVTRSPMNLVDTIVRTDATQSEGTP